MAVAPQSQKHTGQVVLHFGSKLSDTKQNCTGREQASTVRLCPCSRNGNCIVADDKANLRDGIARAHAAFLRACCRQVCFRTRTVECVQRRRHRPIHCRQRLPGRDMSSPPQQHSAQTERPEPRACLEDERNHVPVLQNGLTHSLMWAQARPIVSAS